MMATKTTLPAFLDALAAALATATGGPVYSAAVDAEAMGTDGIALAGGTVTAAYEYETMPRTQVHETYVVAGFIWGYADAAPGASPESAIAAARDAAYALLAKVHGYVATIVGKQATQAALGVDHVRVTGHELEQFPTDAGRGAYVRFTVEADAWFDPA